MSINLNRHKEALLASWKRLLDSSSKTNWVLYGYEAKTFDLCVVGEGDGGLEEFSDEVSSGRIMYGGVRVIDPNSKLPKVVFINWQGEGVPETFRGTCARHVSEVTSFFKGCHITVHARSESDLDTGSIMDKVKRSSGANYSFHKEAPRVADAAPVGTVGSVYVRTNAGVEIASSKKDNFWEGQSKEMKSKEIEEKERLARERQERLNTIKNRELPTPAQVSRPAPPPVEKPPRSAPVESLQKRIENLHMHEKGPELDERQKRNQEMQQMMADRSNAARSFSEQTAPTPAPAACQNTIKGSTPQNAAQGQSKPVLPGSAPSTVQEVAPNPQNKQLYQDHGVAETFTAPPTVSPTVTANTFKPFEHENIQVDVPAEPEPIVYSPPPCNTKKPQLSTDSDVEEASPVPSALTSNQSHYPSDDIYEQILPSYSFTTPSFSVVETPPNAAVHQISEQPITGSNETTLSCRVLFDFISSEPGEINVKEGEIVTSVVKVDEGWWEGINQQGMFGLFPANYVEEISTQSKTMASSTLVPSSPSYEVLYDYTAVDGSELSLCPGDIITSVTELDPNWWSGTNQHGIAGIFPSAYVQRRS